MPQLPFFIGPDGPRISALILSLPIAVTLAGPAVAADMRDCPMDALTFIDPWFEERFEVNAVGADERLMCDGEFIPAAAAANPDSCDGPFGYTFLFGHFSSAAPFAADTPDDPKAALAVWSVLPAAPCCDWELFPVNAFPADHWQGAVLSTPGNAPTLRSIGTATIESAYGQLADIAPLVALDCAVPLE